MPRWCTGCGDNAILAAVQRLCRDEDLRPEKTVFVSGIGCSSRFPHYMKTYGFHGIHGRALPVAEGVKMARPDLARVRQHRRRRLLQHRRGALDPRHPLQHEPDGDPARQPDLRADQEAGVADVAASALKSNTTPRGSYLEALNPLTVTLGVQNVSFVAQAVDWIPEVLYDIMSAGVPPQGASRSCASSSAAPSGCRRCSSRGCTIRAGRCCCTHEDGLQLSPSLSRIYKNQQRARSVEHQPRARDRVAARTRSRSASSTATRTCRATRSCATPGSCVPRDYINAGLDAELDKFTIWPQDADSKVQPSA